MLKFLAVLSGWLLKNSVQKVLSGAGLGLVSYLVILTSVRAAFDTLIDTAYSGPAELLNLMGMSGIDYVIGGFVSVAVFLLTLNSGKLAIRKK